jgi:hypothetical protein
MACRVSTVGPIFLQSGRPLDAKRQNTRENCMKRRTVWDGLLPRWGVRILNVFGGALSGRRSRSISCRRRFVFVISSLPSSNRCACRRESDRTLRDGSLGGCCSRHFVPGYDRTVPPEQKATAHRRASHQVSAYWVGTLG